MPNILVVDDSPVASHLAGKILERELEASVSYASDGKEALLLASQATPDLVVTDLQMPEMDGLELVTRAQVKIPRTPGHSHDGWRDRGNRRQGPANGRRQLRRQATPEKRARQDGRGPAEDVSRSQKAATDPGIHYPFGNAVRA